MQREILSKPTNQERTSTLYSGLQNQQAGQAPTQPTRGSNQAPATTLFPQRPRPTAEQSRQARGWVQEAKSDFVLHTLPALKTYSIPDEQRENFMETMTSVYRVSADFEMKLPMFFYVVQDHNFVCRIIAIILTIQEQMKILQSGGQKYILAPQNLPVLLSQLTTVNQQLHVAVAPWQTDNNDISEPTQSANQERTITPYSGLQNQQAPPPTVSNAGPGGDNQSQHPITDQSPAQPTQGSKKSTC